MPTEKEIVTDELQQMVVRIQDNIETTGTTASGRTAKSMYVKPLDYGAVLFARKYFGGLETGRPAGGVPKGFNAIIKQWIIDKGISITQIPYKRKASNNWQPKYTEGERSLNLAAGAIAFNIKEKGTKLHQLGGRADIYSNELDITVSKIKKRLASEVISQIKSNLKK